MLEYSLCFHYIGLRVSVVAAHNDLPRYRYDRGGAFLYVRSFGSTYRVLRSHGADVNVAGSYAIGLFSLIRHRPPPLRLPFGSLSEGFFCCRHDFLPGAQLRQARFERCLNYFDRSISQIQPL
jgi:hypothetical protein